VDLHKSRFLEKRIIESLDFPFQARIRGLGHTAEG